MSPGTISRIEIRSSAGLPQARPLNCLDCGGDLRRNHQYAVQIWRSPAMPVAAFWYFCPRCALAHA